jgi:hypothetical protein
LGGGHFGTIFAVREVKTGRECVVKLYKRCVVYEWMCVFGMNDAIDADKSIHIHVYIYTMLSLQHVYTYVYICTMLTQQNTHTYVHTYRSQREAALDVAHEKNFLIMARRCKCLYALVYM